MILAPYFDPAVHAEQRRLAGFSDAFTDYNASPISSIAGLAVNAGFGYAAWYLWQHDHQVWGGLLGALAVSGAAYNVYRLTAPRAP